MQHRALYSCADRGFAAGARALFRSAAAAYPEVDRICFTSAADRAYLCETLKGLAEVRVVPRQLRNVPPSRQLMAARVFGATLSADIAVYMDSDIVVCRPGPAIWETDGQTVRAVMDPAKEMFFVLRNSQSQFVREEFKTRFNHLLGFHGVNTGVFSFRPDAWRDLPERFETAIHGLDWGDASYFNDQPFLSAVLLPFVKPLPFAYNAHFFLEIPIPRDVRNLHFTSSAKPWRPGFPRHEPAWWYWLRHGSGLPRLHPRCLLAGLWISVNSPRRWFSRLRRATQDDAVICMGNPAFGLRAPGGRNGA